MKKVCLSVCVALAMIIASAVCVGAADMYVESELAPIVSVEVPTGGGSKDISVICDGVIPTVDDANDTMQYDTYIGRTESAEDYYGYTFPKTYTVKELVFAEGNHFNNGGWFEMGMVRIEALVGGEWKTVEAACDPEYPSALTQDDAGEPYEVYTFTFDPIECDGIRIIGIAGGAASFISCSELKVLATVADDYVVVDAKAEANAKRIEAELAEGYINGLFTPFTSITEPTGGGNKDINIINDGVWSTDGDSNSSIQYDTYQASTDYQDVTFGYDFGGKSYTVSQVDFHEGRQFGDGGWFSNGITVQALVGSDWVDVDAKCSPEYPISDNPDDHLPEAQCFTFTFDPVSCLGIRISGKSSGLGYFTSISELRVKGEETTEAAAEPAPISEPQTEPEQPAEPETVTIPAQTEKTETATEKAPQTLDLGVISAVVCAVSAAGIAISKKKR